MDEFFGSILFETIGAFTRFLFFSVFGRRKAFSAYYNDEYSAVNLLIGVIVIIAVVVLIIILFQK